MCVVHETIQDGLCEDVVADAGIALVGRQQFSLREQSSIASKNTPLPNIQKSIVIPRSCP